VTPAIALAIGVSDFGGGAGIKVDLKTFIALQLHVCSVITCITAQRACRQRPLCHWLL